MLAILFRDQFDAFGTREQVRATSKSHAAGLPVPLGVVLLARFYIVSQGGSLDKKDFLRIFRNGQVAGRCHCVWLGSCSYHHVISVAQNREPESVHEQKD